MKKLLHTIGVFALCIIGACIIIFVLGWIVDLTAHGKLKKEGDKALLVLRKYQVKPEDNAWDYYSLVIKDMKAQNLSFEVTKYLNQEIKLTKEVEQELTAYPDVIQLIRQGNAQPTCWIPIPYEEGATAQIPEYLHLSGAAKLIGAQALAALEEDNTDKMLDRNLLGLAYAKQIVHGSPILINYMVSLVILGVQLHTIEFALMHDSYDNGHLEQLKTTLENYEEDLPSLLTSLEVEQATMALTVSKWPVGNPIFTNIGVLQNSVLHTFGERLISWRYVFSLRNAMLHAIHYTDAMLAAAKQNMKGKKGVDQDLAVLKSLEQSAPDKYAKKNLFYALYMPNFRGMFARKMNQQARVRLVLSGVLLKMHQQKFGNFPEILDAFDPDVFTDPFTNETWEYISKEDKVIIQSPGFDQEYDTDDDLEIVMKK